MIERRIPASGDPFTAKPPTKPREAEKRLAELEDRLAHELLDDAERQELRDRVLRLRHRLGEDG